MNIKKSVHTTLACPFTCKVKGLTTLKGTRRMLPLCFAAALPTSNVPGDAKIVIVSEALVVPSARCNNRLLVISQSPLHRENLTAEQPNVFWHSVTQYVLDLKRRSDSRWVT